MASLKEIKSRINSIRGTLKITSAMKLVASSKLRKAQAAIGNMIPYQKGIYRILSCLLSDGSVPASGIYMAERPVKKVALVPISSNSSLCGAFNSNAIRLFRETADGYMASGLAKEDISVYPVGRKMAEAVRKDGFVIAGDYSVLADRPAYADAASLASLLMDSFARGEVDKIELLYNHYKSSSCQIPVREVFLPLSEEAISSGMETSEDEDSGYLKNYTVEPDAASIVSVLLPKVLLLKVFTVVLDAAEAEHSARTIAMQTATDNANQLLQELSLQYNKNRQQAITNELLDMAGGTIAQ